MVIIVTYPEVVPGMLVIGEIKLKQGGHWQLLAAMQKEANVRNQWPLGKPFVNVLGNVCGGYKEIYSLSSCHMTCIV